MLSTDTIEKAVHDSVLSRKICKRVGETSFKGGGGGQKFKFKHHC